MSVELFVGLVVLVGVGYWLYTRNTKQDTPTEVKPEAVPYKVETPAVEAVVDAAPVVEAAPAVETKPAKAKKAAAPKAAKPKATATKKPATKKPKLKTAK